MGDQVAFGINNVGNAGLVLPNLFDDLPKIFQGDPRGQHRPASVSRHRDQGIGQAVAGKKGFAHVALTFFEGNQKFRTIRTVEKFWIGNKTVPHTGQLCDLTTGRVDNKGLFECSLPAQKLAQKP